ncbi:MAG: 1-acyl-sn-glycerol-3-phosphate acyltransferase [Hyphomonas sp.]|nr:1-acyl-sn-glycerol-3-phosphate acyltransferase [Hyphomonas sp.]
MAVLGVLALPTLLMPRAGLLWFVRSFARLMIFGLRWFCGVRVEIRGTEHVPGGPVLIAGKHQAMLDVFIPFLIFRDPVLVMKRELLWYPVIGWYSLKLRLLAIDRDGGAKTMRKMLQAADARVIGESRPMLIYPEGTRSLPGAKPEYKPAGLRAFYKGLKLPLLPLATNAGLCWPAKGLTRRPGLVVYEVLPPLPHDLNPKTMLVELENVLEAACDRLIDEGLVVQDRTRADL